MKVLVIGSGGREHAIISCLQKQTDNEIFWMGSNGATGNFHKIQFNLSHPFSELCRFAVDNKIDLVVPGPEVPLVDGIQDELKKFGISCFGPSKSSARLEGSKAFSKEFMKKHSIPTADFKVFMDFELAQNYVKNCAPTTIVIKASGLAAGKGVLLPSSVQEAIIGLREIMVDGVFGNVGEEVVIEEKLFGEEVSCLAFSDGYTVIPMPGAQDHKRAFNNDEGPNTGGMGCYAPAPVYTPELQQVVLQTVLQPTIDAMRRSGSPFVGILYAGIMLTKDGPKVLEFNCRFGDPETQVLLPLLDDKCSLADIMFACANGCLDSVSVNWKNSFACTVVAASGGYPGVYKKGCEINIPAQIPDNVIVFHAGTRRNDDGKLVTDGGRVLAVTAVSAILTDAISQANKVLSTIKFEGMHFRTDIGFRAILLLKTQKETHTTYADAGVSIDNGNLLVDKIKPFVKATKRVGADADIGGFGGVFDLKAAGYKDPILISGTDGVGTKLQIAQHIGKHDTIGIDLVAMSVNDVLVQGAEPLYFLDYFASSKLDIDVAADVIKGIAQGCIESGCALIGGETSEMPGIYQRGEYDLAGFVVGAVERDQILPRLDLIKPGDVLLGLASSGIHSNGYSLVRHIVKKAGLEYTSACPFDASKSLGEALLTPTRLYVKPLLPVIRAGLIKSMVHITGGGFIDNIPRSLPSHIGVSITAGSWPLLPVFKWIKKVGNVTDSELVRTFNCGIGMVLVVAKENVARIQQMIGDLGEQVYEIGVLNLLENLSEPVSMIGTK